MKVQITFDSPIDFINWYQQQFGHLSVYRQGQLFGINRSTIKRWLDEGNRPSPGCLKIIGDFVGAELYIK